MIIAGRMGHQVAVATLAGVIAAAAVAVAAVGLGVAACTVTAPEAAADTGVRAPLEVTAAEQPVRVAAV